MAIGFLEEVKEVIKGLKSIGKTADDLRMIKETMQSYQEILYQIERRLENILSKFPFK